jgi:hypothetical protein
MQLSLAHLDLRGLSVELPSASEHKQLVTLRTATALRGLLTQQAGLLRLSDVAAEWLALDALQLVFGSVRISERGEATFGNVGFRFEAQKGKTELTLESQGAHASHLEIDAGSVHLVGDARMQRLRLWVCDVDGTLEAEHARVGGFRMRIGELALSSPEIRAEGLMVGWGHGEFRLEAKKLSALEMRLSIGAIVLDAEGVELEDLHVRGPDVSFGRASVARATLDARFGVDSPKRPKAEGQSEAPAAPREARSVFDYRLLDGLSGALHVDAVVDMLVPILGRRRATHKLRLTVDEGSIDYRELEGDLSALEGSLLDFSVRDGALVLERGIPLLPTRGFGKRLLVWDLSPQDLALAQRRRVKLSVLPQVRLAKDLAQANAERDESSSGFALERLGLENIDLALSLDGLSAPLSSALPKLSFEKFSAQGNLQHELKGEARDGMVHAQLERLDTSIEALSLGELRLDVSELRLNALRDAALSFVGLSLARLQVEIEGLSASGAHLSPWQPPASPE